MAKNSEFWLGPGVICINGKDYGAEMPLPVDEINLDDRKKMKADGRIGAKIAPIVVGCKGCVALKIQVAELESEVKRLTPTKKEKKAEKGDAK